MRDRELRRILLKTGVLRCYSVLYWGKEVNDDVTCIAPGLDIKALKWEMQRIDEKLDRLLKYLGLEDKYIPAEDGKRVISRIKRGEK